MQLRQSNAPVRRAPNERRGKILGSYFWPIFVVDVVVIDDSYSNVARNVNGMCANTQIPKAGSAYICTTY